MAHAIHKIMKENCKDLEFSQCDALQPGPAGPDLLRAIRDVNFIGMQGTQVRFIHSSSGARTAKPKKKYFSLLTFWWLYKYFCFLFSSRFVSVFCLFDRFDSIHMVMHMVTIIFINIKGLEKNMIIFKLEHGRNRKAVHTTLLYLGIYFFFEKSNYLTDIAISDCFRSVVCFLDLIFIMRRWGGRTMISQNQFALNHAQPVMCIIIKINVVGHVLNVAKNLNLWKMTLAYHANPDMHQMNGKMAVIN